MQHSDAVKQSFPTTVFHGSEIYVCLQLLKISLTYLHTFSQNVPTDRCNIAMLDFGGHLSVVPEKCAMMSLMVQEFLRCAIKVGMFLYFYS